MKVFLDANILFSASDPASATRRLLDALTRHGEPVTSPHAWEEARTNLAHKRPRHLPHLADLRERIIFTHAFAPIQDATLPLHDAPILAAACGARCTHLWTGDRRHFGRYYGKTIGGVCVVSGLQLADTLVAAGWRP
ncbi:MAG: PIN domain-containing protein [Planctomycetota bacterium]